MRGSSHMRIRCGRHHEPGSARTCVVAPPLGIQGAAADSNPVQPDGSAGIMCAINIGDGTLPGFKMELRPKLSNYAALGKPVLAGVAGYASGSVRQETAGAAVFVPEV